MSTEAPRPQPKSSLTLLYFLLIAISTQLWSQWILNELDPRYSVSAELVDQEEDKLFFDLDLTQAESESSKMEMGGSSEDSETQLKDLVKSRPPRVPSESGVLFRAAKLLTWAPKHPNAFLPKLLRLEEAEEEDVFVATEVDDTRLLLELSQPNPIIFPYEETPSASTIKTPLQDEKNAAEGATVAKMKTTDTQSSRGTQDTSPKVTGQTPLLTSSTSSTSSAPSTPSQQERSTAQNLERSLDSPKEVERGTLLSSAQNTKMAPSSKANSIKKDQPLNESATPKLNSKDIPSSSSKALAVKTAVKKPRKRPQKRRKWGGVTLYSIEDDSKDLAYFYDKLSKAKSNLQKVRVVHYGDSLIAGDYVTRTVRRLLQKEFGDGGHGYFLAGKGSQWYGRRWVSLKTYGAWKKHRITKPPIKDRSYGLGGVTFRTSQSGAWVRATPTGRHGIGAKVSRLEVHYLAQPNGGKFKISFNGKTVEVDTRAELAEPKLVKLKTPIGRHSVTVKVIGGGEVRLFGIAFERPGGVVYDALGLEGVRAKLLLKMNMAHWYSQIRSRNPDLFVLHYGTNESEQEEMNFQRYRKTLKRVILRFKRAVPKASCLLVSPMDRGKKDPNTGKIRSRRVVRKIVEIQRAVADEEHCAFWSTFDAMGGSGSMGRWYRAHPKLAGGDLTHPTSKGANLIGAMFFAAIMEGYKNYKQAPQLTQ